MLVSRRLDRPLRWNIHTALFVPHSATNQTVDEPCSHLPSSRRKDTSLLVPYHPFYQTKTEPILDTLIPRRDLLTDHPTNLSSVVFLLRVVVLRQNRLYYCFVLLSKDTQGQRPHNTQCSDTHRRRHERLPGDSPGFLPNFFLVQINVRSQQKEFHQRISKGSLG